jgi:hypothetical protein
MNFLKEIMTIMALGDSDLQIARQQIEAEIKRRKHKGELITGYAKLTELAANKGSVFWENGMYCRGYSAAFMLNQNYSRIAGLIENQRLFVYKKSPDAKCNDKK